MRRLSCLSALVLTLALVAAASGDDVGAYDAATDSSTVPDDDSGDSESPPPAASSEPDEPGEVVEITYFDFIDPAQDNPRSNALRLNIERFHELNPDIHVTVELSEAFEDFSSGLALRAASGDGPDVTKIYSAFLTQNVATGVLQPLDPFIGDVDQSDWAVAWDSTVIDGMKWTLPHEYRGSILYYNTDILAEAGVDEIPTTFAELTAAAVAVEANTDKIGLNWGLGDIAITGELFDSYMAQNGEELFDGEELIISDSAAAVAFFDQVQDWHDAGLIPEEAVARGYNDIEDLASTGQAAFTILGSHRLVTIRTASENPDAIQWTAVPEGAGPGTQLAGWQFGIGAFTDHPEESWRFIEYMTSPEAQAITASGGEIPSRPSSLEEPFFSDPENGFLADLAAYFSEAGNARVVPPTYALFTQALVETLQNQYLNGISAQESVQFLTDAYNAAR